ncbi:DegV family protein [Staphylococcus chromogenes]|uniref:DegV family protein n=1 Tax=Staphylococcus chromogenes TaxID=46126 RepID=A0AAE5W8L5_STACR|nr:MULTISPECIES: DegV family protein [Staphylococcus]KDP13392.1 DegV family protein [Staphylococcus chromogenes MU 970]MBP0045873.1 DegV family protein [Staphylococcus chromogenes]MBV5136950.1 DegV family protein [Staphylococcus chromogenes]MBV5190417.1 DegV family protein [Staphylococcus chromogenes]MBW3132711.1 DegV family protein [Staphylococcus chromogenes]
MQRIIVTDSTSDLDQTYLAENNIHIVPLSVTVNGKSYIDQEEISSEEFIQFLDNDENDLKTSQPPLGQFVETYETLTKDGAEVISIHLSSGLSGTYQTAVQASEMVDGKVTVIDSKSIAYGLGYQIQHIVEWLNEGLSTEVILDKIQQLQKNIMLYVVIGKLDRLIKGGRISKTKGMLGNLMKIKPIGVLNDGNLELVHSSRTQGACAKYIAKDLASFLGNDKIKSVAISHANAVDFLDKVKEKLDETFSFSNFHTSFTTPVISTHTGTGAIGLVVLKEQN